MRKWWLLSGLILAVALSGLGTGGSTPAEPPRCADPDDCRLWEAARLSGVRFGFHDENGAGGPDGDLAALEGNAFTNHGVSWAALQPEPGVVTGSMDAACDFAAEHDLFQVGFHFVWDQVFLDDLASWVTDIDDPEALRAVLRERVRIIFDRCPGLDRIDVVNEPLGFLRGTALHRNHFHRVLGDDYIAQLFHLVRAEAPPQVELFLNENFMEYDAARAAAYVALVRGLVEAGAPVDAVGLQTHLLLGEPDWDLYRDMLEQLAALGVKVFVTELDVPARLTDPDRFSTQADWYGRITELCLAVPACDTLIVWGIDDAHTWLDSFDIFTGPDPDPLLFDDQLQRKPAYFAVRDALLRGRGGDHPVAGSALSLSRLGWGFGLAWIASDDARVVAPSPGSRNDPSREIPQELRLELLRPDGSAETIALSPGPTWRVTPGEAHYWSGWRVGRPLVWLRLVEGVGLKLLLFGRGLEPDLAAEGLRVRLAVGTLQTCLAFGPETVTEHTPDRLVAGPAPKPEGWSCADAPAS